MSVTAKTAAMEKMTTATARLIATTKTARNWFFKGSTTAQTQTDTQNGIIKRLAKSVSTTETTTATANTTVMIPTAKLFQPSPRAANSWQAMCHRVSATARATKKPRKRVSAGSTARTRRSVGLARRTSVLQATAFVV